MWDHSRHANCLTVTATSSESGEPLSYPVTALNSAGYPSPAGITADPVILAPIGEHLHVLLVPREEAPAAGFFALPGGFVSPTEEPGTTAQRKLTEKTGVGRVYLEQLSTFGEPGRDLRGWILSIAYLALIDAAQLVKGPGTWAPVDKLPDLAFDHAHIVAVGVERLRGKLFSSNIASGLLPPTFTMRQARLLYETISGSRLDPSNFRRQMEGSGLIRLTGAVERDRPGRPAVVYEFVDSRPRWSRRRAGPGMGSPAATRA